LQLFFGCKDKRKNFCENHDSLSPGKKLKMINGFEPCYLVSCTAGGDVDISNFQRNLRKMSRWPYFYLNR